MPENNLRVIIDTNLLISFLLTKENSSVVSLIANHHLTLLFSEDLLSEFLDVTQRNKFKKYFSKADTVNLLHQLSSRSEMIKVTSKVIVCRDTKDNFLLALAKDGKATHLITGDKDLLILEKFGETIILKINDFLKK